MIKVIEWVFRMLVLLTFGVVAMLALVFCSLLLWDECYLDAASDTWVWLAFGDED